jgi:hypothetical protein
MIGHEAIGRFDRALQPRQAADERQRHEDRDDACDHERRLAAAAPPAATVADVERSHQLTAAGIAHRPWLELLEWGELEASTPVEGLQ